MSDTQEKETAAPAAKSGMMSYVILGVVGLVLTAVAGGGTYYFMAAKNKAAATDSSAAVASQSDSTKKPGIGKADDSSHGELAHIATTKSPDSVIHAEATSSPSTTAHDQNDIDVSSPEFMAEVQRNMDALNMPAEDHLEAIDTTTGKTAEVGDSDIAILEDREKKISEREKAVAAREAELVSMQKKVEKQMAVIEQSESTRILNLAKMYDGMDPKAVAKLAESLDDATIVMLLPRMKQKNASDVLAAMPPVRAAKLSEQLISVGQ